MKRFLRLPTFALVTLLICSMIATGCSVTQFDAVLNEVGPAVTTILDIIALIKGVPVNTALASKVTADVAAIETLDTDLITATAASAPGIRGDINAGFTVLTQDLGSIFVLANVSDVNTQAKLTALIDLIQSAVNIAEAAIPGNTPTSMRTLRFGATSIPNLDASTLVGSWNQILVAKTGNKFVDAYTPKHKLHYHSKVWRIATAGVLN